MSKQLRVTSDLFSNSPLRRATIGFEDIFEDFFRTHPALTSQSGGYPPFNVARITDEDTEQVEYEVTLAVAGFTQDDIEITVEKDTLKVSGTSGVLADEAGKRVEYLHKGIAERSFSREWKLSQHQKVRSAELNDGILRIRVEHIVPEEDMPKRIPIQ